eukprot:GHRR01027134.1.p1 GENE.GHRR01027134.1~~GHRR01027134.1.p1  ORF type:complete len:274 (+),score=50.15 GHRR01027134.1:225-1046(+)
MYALRLRWCSSQIRHRSVRRTGSGMMPTLSRTTGAVDKPGRFMAAAVPTEKQGATLRDSTCSSKPLVDSDKTGSLTSSSGESSRVYLVLLIVAVAGLLLMASGGTSGLRERVEELQVLIASSEYLGPVIFAAAYALFTVLLFPASLLTLAAGYLFGPVKGTALVSASSTLGASLAFLLSRYLVRPAVEAKLADYPRFQAVYRNISTDGAKLVLLLRLSPLIPFNLLNYGLGEPQLDFIEHTAACQYTTAAVRGLWSTTVSPKRWQQSHGLCCF